MDFYQYGQHAALTKLGFLGGVPRALKQLQVSLSTPGLAAGTEIKRMLAGGGLGAVAGGAAGGLGEDGSVLKGLGGAALGGLGGALGARSLGRFQEGRVAKALAGRKDLPFAERSALRHDSMRQLIPRMPNPGKGSASTGGMRIPEAVPGVGGETFIPADVLKKIHANGMGV